MNADPRPGLNADAARQVLAEDSARQVLAEDAARQVLAEDAARQVLMLQAFESTAADSPLWTAEDRAWATRLARETGAATAPPAAALAQRARHALQRLLPRDPAVGRALQARVWHSAWVPAGLVAAFLAGVLVDAIGGSQRINLLAPPVWAVVLWNLVVYLGLLLPKRAYAAAAPGGLRALLARRQLTPAGGAAPLQAYTAAWSRAAWPLAWARASLLLHAAAAALAVGLMTGLYLRGLVLDYRAGWQSTFLDPGAVRLALATLLAPASATTGIAVPDTSAIEALRVLPGAAATASAAPWIHLYAATLLIFVVGPRVLLAGVAAWRARRLAKHLPLPLHEPYFQRLLRDLQGQAANVQVLPHGAAPSPQATLGLRDWLQAALGDGLQLQVAGSTPYGEEERSAAAAEAGCSLRIALVDLGSTPEDDTHGRFLRALRAAASGVPLLLLADEAAFQRRFAGLPARAAERRAAWQQLAATQGAGFLGVNLDQPTLAGAHLALQSALRAA